jgi:hypothetical protein
VYDGAGLTGYVGITNKRLIVSHRKDVTSIPFHRHGCLDARADKLFQIGVVWAVNHGRRGWWLPGQGAQCAYLLLGCGKRGWASFVGSSGRVDDRSMR